MIDSSSRDFPLSFPVLLADIGGTNARFAVLPDRDSEMVLFPKVSTLNFDTLEQAIQQTVLEKVSCQPSSSILAVAGPAGGPNVKLTNYKWSIEPTTLFTQTSLEDILVINDFAAQALAIADISEKNYAPVGHCNVFDIKKNNFASRVILGPGTGLGIAALIRSKNCWIPVSGEAGHIDIGPRSKRDFEIFPYLEKIGGRISAEQLLSGRGLMNIYKAICAADKIKDITCPQSQEITASRSHDPVAYETIKLFCQYLGRVAADIALVFMALGGVYLSGGIPENIIEALSEDDFEVSFKDKAPHQAFMSKIPTYRITHPCIALLGMASYVRNFNNYSLIEGASQRWFR